VYQPKKEPIAPTRKPGRKEKVKQYTGNQCIDDSNAPFIQPGSFCERLIISSCEGKPDEPANDVEKSQIWL
jgi:hypothetical protein